MKLDMHGHTYWSKDSQLALADLEQAIQRAGLDAVCITDHNEIGGALELAARGKVRVIPGEEVYTTEGEVIGLFLTEKIPARLSPQETITAIHEQGGIVYIPHPLDRFRGSRLQPAALAAVLDQVDVFEVFNARNLLTGDNTRALQLARTRGLRQGAGSDSHTAHEVGHAYVELPDFQTAAELLRALESAAVHGRRTNPLVHVRTRIDKTMEHRAPPR
ncbi:MAG TPA: PHP domain-containing protein [Chloroflexota bacterium]